MKTDQISVGKPILLDVHTDVEWLMCWEQMDATLFVIPRNLN